MAEQKDYLPKSIEPKWQAFWEKHQTFKTEGPDSKKPKYYVLDMFPYPSGEGLHVGHPLGYTATDIVARYQRMKGFNVLHPMGWDAFGLPAEQYAVKTGTHPEITTKKNITRFKSQLQSLGFSYDWTREVNTTSPDYFRWTQWIFARLFEKGLAYESFAPVNWCEALGTVLANEEVIDGKSEIGNFPVTKKPMRQWVLKITAYAERLLADLNELDWPEAIKNQQRHWIGKSEGANLSFPIQAHPQEKITVFTTRADTIFGVGFMVLAPENPLVETITTPKQMGTVKEYQHQAASKTDLDRQSSKEKSGVFTGAYAIHPLSQKTVPIYCADYVMMTYGHGAVMGVPAHDDRDFEFAKLMELEIPIVIAAPEHDFSTSAYTGDGAIINSDFLDGLAIKAAQEKVIAAFAKLGLGEATVNYKLRDWLFSRQRYWGEPIPVAHDEQGQVYLVPDHELPVSLPELEDYKPSGNGEPPLAKAPKEWSEWTYKGKKLKRETNVMPQWGGSCWYYLRFMDPTNQQEIFSKAAEGYFNSVDLYVGGAEHAVLHLLYARFWHKVLYDLGLVSTKEPFKKLVNQGLILGSDGQKMSKSRGNVVNPDDVIAEHGADALRLYEMFMGPFEALKPWATNGIIGCSRFLNRFWRLISQTAKVAKDSETFNRSLHKAIKKVTQDIEALSFNTVVSTLMELVNEGFKEPGISQKSAETMVLLLSPLAPHVSEELWEELGHKKTLAYESWPSYDPKLCQDNTFTLAVQVNGKLRTTLELSVQASKEEILALAKSTEAIKKQLEGGQLKKEIYVPGKILNFVIAPKP